MKRLFRPPHSVQHPLVPYRRGISAQEALTSPAGLAALLAPRPREGEHHGSNQNGADDHHRGWRGFLRQNRQTLFLGGVIFVASSLSDVVRARVHRMRTLVQEYLYVNLEVRSHQPEYSMLLEWLSKQPIGTTSHNMALKAIRDVDSTRSDEQREEARLSRITRDEALLSRAKDEHRTLRRRAQVALSVLNGTDGLVDEATETFSEEFDSPSPLAPVLDLSIPGPQGAAPAASSDQPFIPGYGVHRVVFEGHTVWVTRDIDQDRKTGPPSEDRSPDEVLTFVTLGWNRGVMERLVMEARMTSVRDHIQSVRVHIPQWSGWALLNEKPKRYLDSVFLPHNTKSELHRELTSFFSQRDVYRALGIPWRRGYMFYGPPGTGKSSLILALAGEHNLPIYVLPIDSELNDTRFLTLVNAVPTTASLLVIEDLDTALNGIQGVARRDDTKADGAEASPHSGRLSLSGVLNAIDGIASSEGRVLIVTSNTPTQQLPKALLRPGRIDRVVEFGPIQEAELTAMLKHFKCDDASTGRLTAEGAGRVSPAQVQAALQLAGFNCSQAHLDV